jgi:hypothetical protein
LGIFGYLVSTSPILFEIRRIHYFPDSVLLHHHICEESSTDPRPEVHPGRRPISCDEHVRSAQPLVHPFLLLTSMRRWSWTCASYSFPNYVNAANLPADHRRAPG